MLKKGFVACFGLLVCEAALAESPRAARSVHLRYPAERGEFFYNEVVVEQTTGGSYFMACGWDKGYFGIQQLDSSTNKLVLFSVWDPTQGNDPNEVPRDDRVEVLFEGQGTRVKRFGGEGTGGQCFWPYQWETNEVCRFLVQATVTSNKTSYAGWFYDNHAKAWRHLVTFRTKTGGKALGGYYSFIEDFRRDGVSAGEVRRARFGNGWVRSLAGRWIHLHRAKFTGSGADWEAKDTINAGFTNGMFFLSTGGKTTIDGELGKEIDLPVTSEKYPDVPDELIANPSQRTDAY